jgi:hypothetical protein
MDLVGSLAIAFDLISSEYGWDDEVILDKSLRRIRQILAAITYRKLEQQRIRRQELSWQTRSLAMVISASTMEPNESVMKFAANLTIDNEEYAEFGQNEEQPVVKAKSKLKVHANTQDTAVEQNFEAAANRNSFEMLSMFGMKVEETPPGQ